MAFQRRFDGSVGFHQRKWNEYKLGFGDSEGEYYLGNELLHQLTKTSHDYMMEATSFSDEVNFKRIRNVVIAGENDNYRIQYAAENIESTTNSQLACGLMMRNQPFSTADRDNEDSSSSCGQRYGGWWHGDCHYCAMNGQYRQEGSHTGNYISGIIWIQWKTTSESLKKSLLMIRPSQ